MRSAPATIANDIALGETHHVVEKGRGTFTCTLFSRPISINRQFKKASKISLLYNYNYDHNFQYVVTLKQSSD